MFRDMADYVVLFPFEHHGESMTTVSIVDVAPCLRPGAIIYCKSEGIPDFCNILLPHLTQPFVFITGQSTVEPVDFCPSLLDHPLLIRWFAQNAEHTHEKLETIPLGLNCFEHAEEMHTFLQSRKDELDAPKAERKLALVNFGTTSHPGRPKLRETLCQRSWIDCPPFTRNSIRGNPHLVEMYRNHSNYVFWYSPRGKGLDCHRTWEALYAGSVPIVERSALDLFWQDGDLPVLVVDSLLNVTEAELQHEYRTRFSNLDRDFPKLRMTRDYWRQRILRYVDPDQDRRVCWGPQ